MKISRITVYYPTRILKNLSLTLLTITDCPLDCPLSSQLSAIATSEVIDRDAWADLKAPLPDFDMPIMPAVRPTSPDLCPWNDKRRRKTNSQQFEKRSSHEKKSANRPCMLYKDEKHKPEIWNFDFDLWPRLLILAFFLDSFDAPIHDLPGYIHTYRAAGTHCPKCAASVPKLISILIRFHHTHSMPLHQPLNHSLTPPAFLRQDYQNTHTTHFTIQLHDTQCPPPPPPPLLLFLKGSMDRSFLPSAIFLIFTRNRPW